MIRPRRAVVIVMIVAAGAVRSSAQSSPAPLSAQAALDEARQLSQQVEKLYGEGKPQEAVEPAERALALRERALGAMHPDIAVSLNDLALLHYAQGAYDKAEPLYIRALDIREKAFVPNHRDVAEILNNLASLYLAQGAYGKAEPLYIRALDIREKALGPTHPLLANSLNNLAESYRARGAYDKAEPLYIRALDILEKAPELSDRKVAPILNNLALLYRARGAYSKAEPLHTRAIGIIEKALGPVHPVVAIHMGNLAQLYQDQGAYSKAEPLFVRALEILERALGPTHPDIATGLSRLAGVYLDQGAYAKAESLYLRALEICEQALLPTHRVVASSLDHLAAVYQAQGMYGKAEPLYRRALEIRGQALGPTHPDIATSLSNIAGIYLDQGAYGEAEPSYTRALEIREQALGPSHPEVAISLNRLAGLYRAQGAYGRAVPLFARAADIQEQRLGTELVALPEPRKRALMALLQRETDSVVSLHADAMPSSAPALELALTTVLRRKGRTLDSLVDSETTLRSHLTPPLRDQLDQLSQARAEFVAQLYTAAGPHGATDRAATAATRARVDALESALSAASAEVRTEVEPVTLANIQAAVPAGAAMVEFVRYRRAQQSRQPRRAERYLAYVLTVRGAPQWVALGEAAPIDAQIDAVLAALRGKAPEKTTRAALRRLDALVLAPIRARLAGISHVILAPDSKLNLVPFEALVDPQGHYALENHLISYVTTGRDLLRLASPPPPRSSAVVIASPDYGPLPASGPPGAVAFPPLPDALGEAADLRPYFASEPLTGASATKAALAALTGPAMLHIATHGFYARGPDPSAKVIAPTAVAPNAAFEAWSEATRGMLVDGGAFRSDELADALDRSGLALAGANQGVSGIVTAREIAGFDWWGTQLVVLSACDTGVGAASSGDGVYGLRRALVLAGAASHVVSLWNVDDSATRLLMRDFYAALARGAGRAEALRQAKLRFLRQPRFEHPYYWAAFIAAGDWRPLGPGTIAQGRRGAR